MPTQNNQKGKYKFVSQFKHSQCTKPINYACAETTTTIFKVGDVVNINDFFFDDKINDWNANIVLNGQNIPVALNKLIKVDDSTTVSSPQQIVNNGGLAIIHGSPNKGLSNVSKGGIAIGIILAIFILLKLFKVF